MAVQTAVFVGLDTGPESRRSPSESEFWSIPAATAADTCAVTARQITSVRFALGFAGWSISSISGRVVNLVCDVTTAGTSYGEVVGYAL